VVISCLSNDGLVFGLRLSSGGSTWRFLHENEFCFLSVKHIFGESLCLQVCSQICPKTRSISEKKILLRRCFPISFHRFLIQTVNFRIMQFSKVFFFFFFLNNYSSQNPLLSSSRYICSFRFNALL
jgi:hypothetical protein